MCWEFGVSRDESDMQIASRGHQTDMSHLPELIPLPPAPTKSY